MTGGGGGWDPIRVELVDPIGVVQTEAAVLDTHWCIEDMHAWYEFDLEMSLG